MKISQIKARTILDSRGNPTIEADVTLADNNFGRASVPSGASTGAKEASELRDKNSAKYSGKGVEQAVNNINEVINEALVGQNATHQSKIDNLMISLDGTTDKSNLGSNAILAVSLAVARAAANYMKMPLYKYLSTLSKDESDQFLLPTPMLNLINGGAHANFATDIQEYMIIPIGATSFSDAIRWGSEIFHALEKILEEKGLPTTVGDEGGFVVRTPKQEEVNTYPLDLLSLAVTKSGYRLGSDIVFALDIAASELFHQDAYHLDAQNKIFSSIEMIKYLEYLIKQYPIISIEDGLAEEDWVGWQEMTRKLGKKIQLVGDDLITTNTLYLKRAINENAGNAVLVKPNQIGTLTETIEIIDMARQYNWHRIISHRSGETEDTFISDLAVGLSSGQIKAGSVSRTDSVGKYNRLLEIEEELGNSAKYAGNIWHI